MIATYIGSMVYVPTDFLEGLEAMLFFYIGHMARQNKLLEMKISGRFVAIVVLLTGLSIFSGSMSMVRCYYGYWPINYLAAIGMTVILYHLSKRLSNNRFLVWCGRMSMVILCVHIVELTFLPYIYVRFGMPHYCEVFMHLLVAITVTSIILRLGVVKRIFSVK